MRDINRTVEISVVDEENNVIGFMPINEARDKGVHHRTIHIIATLDENLVLQRLSQKHINSPNLIGSSAAGFVLKDESPDNAARRIIKKELGIVVEGLMPIKTIMLMEGKARKFVSIYWVNLIELPKQNPSEFSNLLQLRVEEVEILLLNTSSNFAKIFQPVFEEWSNYVQKFHNKLIVADKR